MSSTEYKIGDRVQLTLFQMKGKLATVRFFGGRGPKVFGKWVGCELDEPFPSGHDGSLNDDRLFECPNGHGYFARQTQVKHYVEGASPAKKPVIPSLSEGIKVITENRETGIEMGDSPLVSPAVGGKAPKDTPNSMAASQSNLMNKMELASEEQKSEVKAKPAAAGGASGWKAKLEKIKAQKAARAEEEKKKAADEAAKQANMDPEIQEIRDQLGPDQSIQRDQTGNLVVQQTEEQRNQPNKAESILQKSKDEKEAAAIAKPVSRLAGVASGNIRSTTSRVATAKATGGQTQADRIEAYRKQRDEKQQQSISGSASLRPGGKPTLAEQREQRQRSNSRTATTGSSRFTTPTPAKTIAGRAGAEEGKAAPGSKYLNPTAARKVAEPASGSLSARPNSRIRQPASREEVGSKVTSGIAARTTAARTGLNSSIRKDNASGAMSARGTGATATGTRSGAALNQSGRANVVRGVAAGADGAQIKKLEDEVKEFKTKAQEAIKLSQKVTELTKKIEKLDADHKKDIGKLEDTTNAAQLKAKTLHATEKEKLTKKLETEHASQLKKLETEKTVLEKKFEGEGKLAQTKLQSELQKKADAESKAKTQKLESELKAANENVTSLTKTNTNKDAKIMQLTQQSASSETEALTQIKDQADENMARALKAEQDLQKLNSEADEAKKALEEELAEAQQKLSQIQEELVLAEESLKAQQEATRQAEEAFQTYKLQQNESEEGSSAQFAQENEALKEAHKLQISEIKQQKDTELAEQKQELTTTFESEISQLKQTSEEALKEKVTEAETALLQSQQAYEAQKAFQQEFSQRDEQFAVYKNQISELEASLATEKEETAEKIEIMQLEKEELLDQKDELVKQIADSAKEDENDPLKDISSDELKSQNKKLRLAITTLTIKYQEDNQRLGEQISDKSEQQKIIADYEQKLQGTDFLLDEIDKKEADRKNMEVRLEEMFEYEAMVEEMVTEIETKEKENEELKARVTELEESYYAADELNTEFETNETSLEKKIDEKDFQIEKLKKEMEKLEEMCLDEADDIDKYRNKLTEINKANSQLVEQMQQSEGTDDNKDNVSRMLERIQQLSKQNIQLDKKELASNRQLIEFNQQKMRSQVVASMLTKNLQKELMLDTLETIEFLNQLRHRSMLLIREICEKQVVSAEQVFELEPDALANYVKSMMKMALLCSTANETANHIHFYISNMTVGQYQETSKLAGWRHVNQIIECVDMASDIFKDESMSADYKLDSFKENVTQLEKLRDSIQNHFMDPSPEDLMKEDMQEGLGNQGSPEQKKRQKLANRCTKLNLRKQAVNMAIAVVFTKTLAGNQLECVEEKNQINQKGKLVYWRLFELILKLDSIQNKESGDEYLNLGSLSTDFRLEQKFDSMRELWENAQPTKKNWISIIDATERDISELSADASFRKLSTIVEQKYPDNKVEFLDLYCNDPGSEGPWKAVAAKVKSEIEAIEQSAQKIQNLQDKQKELTMTIISNKKDMQEEKLINQTLEKKLGQQMAKADRIPVMEQEAKNFEQKLKAAATKLETSQTEIRNRMSAEDALKKELELAKENAVKANAEKDSFEERQGAMMATNVGQQPGRKKPTHRSRVSRHENFFNNFVTGGLPKDGGAGHAPGHSRQMSTYNNTKALSDLQASQDVYMEIVSELQANNAKLKGREMRDRLLKLDTKDSAFGYLLKQVQVKEAIKQDNASNDTTSAESGDEVAAEEQKTLLSAQTRGVKVNLNAKDRKKVEIALNGVDQLKKNAKRQMAKARILDFGSLSKPGAEVKQEVRKAAQTEQLNYMVVEAREKISQAMKVLFSNDSRLKNLCDSSILRQKDKLSNAPSSDQEEIKFGQFKVLDKTGKSSTIPRKKVVVDESHMIKLKRKLELFVN